MVRKQGIKSKSIKKTDTDAEIRKSIRKKMVCLATGIIIFLLIMVSGLFLLTHLSKINSEEEINRDVLVRNYGYHPEIFKNNVVWQDHRNDNYDIYLFNLTSREEIPICTASGNQENPRIYENYIVWQDSRNGRDDIYMFDLLTLKESPVCTEEHDQTNPVIFGDIIVWTDYRNTYYDKYFDLKRNYGDIYYYNISSGITKQITRGPTDKDSPKIYGEKIIFFNKGWKNESEQYFHDSLFLYDLSTNITTELIKDNVDSDYLDENMDIYQNYVTYKTHDYYHVYLNIIDINTKQSKQIKFKEFNGTYDQPRLFKDLLIWKLDLGLVILNLTSNETLFLNGDEYIHYFSFYENTIVYQILSGINPDYKSNIYIETYTFS